MKFKIDKLNFQIKLTIEKWTEPMSTVAIYIYEGKCLLRD